MTIINFKSLRTRLLLAYTGLIVIGFTGVTLIAGQQISDSARLDYEQRLVNEVTLVARGVEGDLRSIVGAEFRGFEFEFFEGFNYEDLDALIKVYEDQIGATITLFAPEENMPPFVRNGQHRFPFTRLPEITTALNGRITLDRRKTPYDEEFIFTAAPILADEQLLGFVQLGVPAENIDAAVAERWTELILWVVGLLAVSLLASLWLSRSLIHPLQNLRESATQLSTGDFSHRARASGIDEINAVALAFNNMAFQVESMLEEQRAFASNTSHELRTPLTTMRLRTEALRYDASMDEPTIRRYVEEIDDEVIRLSNLIEDLTLLSRLDAGRAELGKEQIDFHRFASSLAQRMNLQAKEKNLQITLDSPEQPILLHASLNHLTVVFRNLLDNAIKYSEADGGNIHWTLELVNSKLHTTITDSGRGIADEHLDHIFERFYRADKARSRDVPGTGLGLALVKSIVEVYGGSITIESQGIGQGTIVHITWPALSAEAIKFNGQT